MIKKLALLAYCLFNRRIRTSPPSRLLLGLLQRAGVGPAMVAVGMLGVAGNTAAVNAPEVKTGDAQVKMVAGGATVTQTSQRAVINWGSFDIAKDETVKFVQPLPTSETLNRVTSNTRTTIDGALQANGRVYIVNPAGVMFGPGAKVDVGALVASSLSITDQDFMSGNRKFVADGEQSGVSNSGTIDAVEFVALMGSSVWNEQEGLIKAGSVALAAADAVTMTLNSGLQLQVDKGALAAIVNNAGKIKATGTEQQPVGSVTLTAVSRASAEDSVTRALVNNEGVITANSVNGDGGRIVLEAGGVAGASNEIDQHGVVDASGSNNIGGQIGLLAEQINISADSQTTVGVGGRILAAGTILNDAPTELKNQIDMADDLGRIIDHTTNQPLVVGTDANGNPVYETATGMLVDEHGVALPSTAVVVNTKGLRLDLHTGQQQVVGHGIDQAPVYRIADGTVVNASGVPVVENALVYDANGIRLSVQSGRPLMVFQDEHGAPLYQRKDGWLSDVAGNRVMVGYTEGPDKDFYHVPVFVQISADGRVSMDSGGRGISGWRGDRKNQETMESALTKLLRTSVNGVLPVGLSWADVMAAAGNQRDNSYIGITNFERDLVGPNSNWGNSVAARSGLSEKLTDEQKLAYVMRNTTTPPAELVENNKQAALDTVNGVSGSSLLLPETREALATKYAGRRRVDIERYAEEMIGQVAATRAVVDRIAGAEALSGEQKQKLATDNVGMSSGVIRAEVQDVLYQNALRRHDLMKDITNNPMDSLKRSVPAMWAEPINLIKRRQVTMDNNPMDSLKRGVPAMWAEPINLIKRRQVTMDNNPMDSLKRGVPAMWAEPINLIKRRQVTMDNNPMDSLKRGVPAMWAEPINLIKRRQVTMDNNPMDSLKRGVPAMWAEPINLIKRRQVTMDNNPMDSLKRGVPAMWAEPINLIKRRQVTMDNNPMDSLKRGVPAMWAEPINLIKRRQVTMDNNPMDSLKRGVPAMWAEPINLIKRRQVTMDNNPMDSLKRGVPAMWAEPINLVKRHLVTIMNPQGPKVAEMPKEAQGPGVAVVPESQKSVVDEPAPPRAGNWVQLSSSDSGRKVENIASVADTPAMRAAMNNVLATLAFVQKSSDTYMQKAVVEAAQQGEAGGATQQSGVDDAAQQRDEDGAIQRADAVTAEPLQSVRYVKILENLQDDAIELLQKEHEEQGK